MVETIESALTFIPPNRRVYPLEGLIVAGESLSTAHEAIYLAGTELVPYLCLPEKGSGLFRVRHNNTSYSIMARTDGDEIARFEVKRITNSTPADPVFCTGTASSTRLWGIDRSAATVEILKRVLQEGEFEETDISFCSQFPIDQALDFAESFIDDSRVIERAVKNHWGSFRGLVLLEDWRRKEVLEKRFQEAGVPYEDIVGIMRPLEMISVMMTNNSLTAGEVLNLVQMDISERLDFTDIRNRSCQGPNFSEVSDFVDSVKPVHISILNTVRQFEGAEERYNQRVKEVYADFMKRKLRDLLGLQSRVADLEAEYSCAVLRMQSEINEALKAALTPVISSIDLRLQERKIQQDLERELAIERLMEEQRRTGGHLPEELKEKLEELQAAVKVERKPTLAVLREIESLTGGETAEELDRMAERINNYYRTLTVASVIREKEAYGLTDEDLNGLLYEEQKWNLVDLHKKWREGTADCREIRVATRLFRKVDFFEPLMKHLADIFTAVPLPRAEALMYLLYQIENPFMGPGREALRITREANELYNRLHPDHPFGDEVIEKVAGMVDEFVLTARNWKSAWTYFGYRRAQDFLDLLQNPTYGPRLFADLATFAQEDIIIAPAQILAIARQISTMKDVDSILVLRAFYRGGGCLVDWVRDHGTIHQISGLQRAGEYGKYLSEWISERYRDRILLSLGGGSGVIEAKRVQMLGLTGPLVVLDQHTQEQLLEGSLVFRNEFRFKEGDPCLTADEIKEIWSQSPAPLTFVQARLPLTPEEVRDLLASHGVDTSLPIGIISDQRVSALYLSGSDFLSSIRTSLQLLAQNGGIYFCTKGWANKLFVDQIVEVRPGAEQSRVSWRLIHHTNTFFSSGRPLINGKIAARGEMSFAEGGTRYIRNEQGQMESAVFQPGRASEALSRQQEIQTIALITDEFYSRYPYFIRSADHGSLGYFFVNAWAASRELSAPLGMLNRYRTTMPERLRSVIQVITTRLSRLIDIYYSNPGLLRTTDLTIDGHDWPGYEAEIIAVNEFIGCVGQDPSILQEPLGTLEELFRESHQLATIPPDEYQAFVGDVYREEGMDTERARYFMQIFRERFRVHLKNFEGVHFADEVADAIFDLVGLVKAIYTSGIEYT